VTEPDLFVVCKNCSAEVSPYVTECPYCGQRVRKRAPKIGPDGSPQVGRLRRKPPKLPKLRPGEIPGIAPETPPRATQLLIVLALLAMIVAASDEVTYYDLGALIFPIDGDWWRVAATPFLYDNLGYAFIALTATGIFGMHLERRFGRITPVLIFLAAGAAGAALSNAADVLPAVGANGAALGLLCAWLVEDRMAARRGDDRENDLLGVYVIAGLLFALSLATEDASIVAAVGGAAVGTIAGLLLSAIRR
jgi:membrane associated rhomboid family serine protease